MELGQQGPRWSSSEDEVPPLQCQGSHLWGQSQSIAPRRRLPSLGQEATRPCPHCLPALSGSCHCPLRKRWLSALWASRESSEQLGPSSDLRSPEEKPYVPNLSHPTTTATAEAVGDPGIWPGDLWFPGILNTVRWRLWKNLAAVTERVMRWEALQLLSPRLPPSVHSQSDMSECVGALGSLPPPDPPARRSAQTPRPPAEGPQVPLTGWRPFPVLHLSGRVGWGRWLTILLFKPKWDLQRYHLR